MTGERHKILDNGLCKLLSRRYDTIEKLSSRHEKSMKYFELFQAIFAFLTDPEKLYFSDLFSRISYVSSKYNFHGEGLQLCHRYRMHWEGAEEISPDEIRPLGAFLNKGLILHFAYGKDFPSVPEHLRFLLRSTEAVSAESADFKAFQKVILEKIIFEGDCILLGKTENEEQQHIKAILRKELLHAVDISFLQYLESAGSLPTKVSLIDSKRDDFDNFYPAAICWMPDYLLSVTSISQCFSTPGDAGMTYLLNLLKPQDNIKYLLAGNVSNLFLDKLLANIEVSYEDLLAEAFEHYGIQFSTLSNDDLSEVLERLSIAYPVLKSAISEDFARENINEKKSIIEPSFMSPEYGIQGRLDLLYLNPDMSSAQIVELKSGRPFLPNKHRLGKSHYIQTLLYEMLIKPAYPQLINRRGYILYAREGKQPLRYTPPESSLQYDALRVRNQLMIALDQLRNLKDDSPGVLDKMSAMHDIGLKGYTKTNLNQFKQHWKALTETERAYARALYGMIAREQKQALLGSEAIGNRGFSTLWNSNRDEKLSNFNLMTGLKVTEDKSDDITPLIHLGKSENARENLANFRKGDIVLLYKSENIKFGQRIREQIFKSTIVKLNSEEIVLRLRARQSGESPFAKNKLWSIEHDVMGSSFRKLYQNIAIFMNSPSEKRALALGERAPSKPKSNINYRDSELSDIQNVELNKMLNAEDYYLLWGPPGTGKTSKLLRHFVKYLYHYTEERILILAYTNRAVDEICHNLEDIHNGSMMRIGSRYGVGDAYRKYLLQKQCAEVKDRKSLLAKLVEKRIYVATLSSFYGKMDLTKLLDFDRVIIDEGSQILDNMLLPIFAMYKSITLIGDHKQLPAVVTQDVRETKINHEGLKELGFHNLSESLFERLYRRAVDMNWTWAYGMLSEQGRMHREIMNFVSGEFYNNSLDIFSTVERLSAKSLPFKIQSPKNSREINTLHTQRCVFYDSGSDIKSIKTWEANKISELLKLYLDAGLDAVNIGIITPYREQIARIYNTIDEELHLPDIREDLQVDTVERFQGSSKDLIFISLASEKIQQLKKQMHSHSDLEINRKLNVALSRAKEQIIFLGSASMMEKVPHYKSVLEEFSWALDQKAT